MRKSNLILVTLFLLLSCSNKFKKVETFIDKGEYINAKIALNKITLNNKNTVVYKKKNQIIDSGLYANANNSFINGNNSKALNLLNNIDENNEINLKKKELLKQIRYMNDTSYFSLAKKYFNEKKYNESLEVLGKIYYYNLKVERTNLTKKINKILKGFKKRISLKERIIAKCVISSIFGRPISTMKVKSLQETNGDLTGIYEVTYVTSGKKYVNHVKFEKNRAIWGAKYGRWRTENKLTYYETNNAYHIREVYSDGSERVDKFSK